MTRYIALITLLCLTSSKTFASFIYADDFNVGSNTTHLTDGVTLSWLSGTGNVSASSARNSDIFYHQHFGGLAGAATFGTFPGILQEVLGSPNPQTYAALQINFDAPVRSFGMKAETANGDPFVVYVFGADNNFVEMLSGSALRTDQRTRNDWPLFDGNFYWNFGYDVGQIKVGSSDSAGYIYALDVTQVPEPSSFILLGMGLLCILKARRSVNNRFPKLEIV